MTIQGQLTEEQFVSMLSSKSPFEYNVNYITKIAIVRYGKNTVNYYRQHDDGSWTNYDCKTVY